MRRERKENPWRRDVVVIVHATGPENHWFESSQGFLGVQNFVNSSRVNLHMFLGGKLSEISV
jgi:hypothetical protein